MTGDYLTERIELVAVTQPLVGGWTLDDLVEYAARVCYRSTANMGHSPGFIAKRIEEGHLDVLEHVHFLFRIPASRADMFEARPGMSWRREPNGDLLLNVNARHLLEGDEFMMNLRWHVEDFMPRTLQWSKLGVIGIS